MRLKSAICLALFLALFAMTLCGQEKRVLETQFFSLETELSA